MATWSSCGGPRRSTASELAVVPSPTPGSRSRNAWPVRPRLATSRHRLSPTSLRALDRVPSGVAACADRPGPHSSTHCGSVFTIKSGSHFQIGPIKGLTLTNLTFSFVMRSAKKDEPCEIEFHRAYACEEIRITVSTKRKDGRAFCRDLMSSLESEMKPASKLKEATAKTGVSSFSRSKK